MLIPDRFYDQPNGHCHLCRWNLAAIPGGLNCSVPQTLLTNPMCMMKIQICWISNIEHNQHPNEDEEWKQEDAP